MIRETLASCYYHLGIPSVVRGIRERYRLSVSGGSVRCSRRAEPSLRILYYHRVNDDNDRFFPALPTKQFEQQIRYVARHYRVVSLRDAISHLSDGNGPVTALTFDDGYADNYYQALPILRRYNIPATIFLTTGSIDEREPMWFEQLAEAAKRTQRESFVLEIGKGQRFWFRTEAERRASSGGIFSVLRMLPDGERREWLKTILRQLHPLGTFENHNRMLTWDQIRAMRKSRIDFGGHTVSHPFVSKLTREGAEWELGECKRRIEAETQTPVEHFAYPNGREEDFNPWSKDVLRNAGYRAAVTTLWGPNYPGTDLMELRRGQPWEENLAMFALKLDCYELMSA